MGGCACSTLTCLSHCCQVEQTQKTMSFHPQTPRGAGWTGSGATVPPAPLYKPNALGSFLKIASKECIPLLNTSRPCYHPERAFQSAHPPRECKGHKGLNCLPSYLLLAWGSVQPLSVSTPSGHTHPLPVSRPLHFPLPCSFGSTCLWYRGQRRGRTSAASPKVELTLGTHPSLHFPLSTSLLNLLPVTAPTRPQSKVSS